MGMVMERRDSASSPALLALAEAGEAMRLGSLVEELGAAFLGLGIGHLVGNRVGASGVAEAELRWETVCV